LECGFYKGRMVVDMAAKKKAREERIQAKKEAIRAETGLAEPEAPAEKDDKEAAKTDK
jgi:hypothetical protein